MRKFVFTTNSAFDAFGKFGLEYDGMFRRMLYDEAQVLPANHLVRSNVFANGGTAYGQKTRLLEKVRIPMNPSGGLMQYGLKTRLGF